MTGQSGVGQMAMIRHRHRGPQRHLLGLALISVAVVVLHVMSQAGQSFVGLQSSSTLNRRRQTSPMPTSRGATSTVAADDVYTDSRTADTDRRTEEAQKLLEEVREVAQAAGLRAGLVRTVQGARAAVSTAVELLRNGDGAVLLDAISKAGEPGAVRVDDAVVARTLRILFERLGATYIKLGQFIASSPTLFPAVYVTEFQKCLDKTDPVPYSVIERIVEEDLGRPIFTAFRKFDRRPLASASVAQVHAATLLTGEDVVVKVLKPGVAETMQADLAFLYIAVRVLEFLNPELSRSSLGDIIAEIRTSMLNELDLDLELENMEVFRDFLVVKGLTDVAAAPMSFPEVSSKRVLTMERFYGVPLVDLEGIRNYTSNPEQTLISALNVWALSVQQCEIFHADVHAGNLLVLEDGRIGFIDFGIVGRVPPPIWQALQDFGVGFIQEDTRKMARALISMGATGNAVDEDKFASDLEGLFSRVTSLQTEFVVRQRQDGTVRAQVELDDQELTQLVLDVVRVADENDLKLPREFALLLKQALYFDRYTKLLAPELDPLRDDRINFRAAPM